MTDRNDMNFFVTPEAVRRAFGKPEWAAGTELVCYCHRADNREQIEQMAGAAGWKIVRYVYIDDTAAALFQKPGNVMFALREAVDWTPMDSTEAPYLQKFMPNYYDWTDQMLGGLRPQDWKMGKENDSKQ